MKALKAWKDESEKAILSIAKVPMDQIPLIMVKQHKRIVALVELVEKVHPTQATLDSWRAEYEVGEVPRM